MRWHQLSRALLFLALSSASNPRRQPSLQSLLSGTTLCSQNTYSTDHRPSLSSFTSCTWSHYRRGEPIARAVLPFSSRIQRRPDLHHCISIQGLCSPLTVASTFSVEKLAPPPTFPPRRRRTQAHLASRPPAFATDATTSLPFLQTDRTFSAHSVNTIPTSTHCPYTSTWRHEDVPSSKKRRPNARDPCSQPRFSTPSTKDVIQYNLRLARWQFLKLCTLRCIRSASASKHTYYPPRASLYSNFAWCVEFNFIIRSMRGVTQKNLLLMHREISKLCTSCQLPSVIYLEEQASLRQKRWKFVVTLRQA